MENLGARTCLKCGTVYFGVTREFAKDEVERFNAYFATLAKKEQDDYYGGKGSSIKTYENCYCGSSHTNFRDFKPGDCPDGVTMSPIIVE